MQAAQPQVSTRMTEGIPPAPSAKGKSVMLGRRARDQSMGKDGETSGVPAMSQQTTPSISSPDEPQAQRKRTKQSAPQNLPQQPAFNTSQYNPTQIGAAPQEDEQLYAQPLSMVGQLLPGSQVESLTRLIVPDDDSANQSFATPTDTAQQSPTGQQLSSQLGISVDLTLATTRPLATYGQTLPVVANVQAAAGPVVLVRSLSQPIINLNILVPLGLAAPPLPSSVAASMQRSYTVPHIQVREANNEESKVALLAPYAMSVCTLLL